MAHPIQLTTHIGLRYSNTELNTCPEFRVCTMAKRINHRTSRECTVSKRVLEKRCPPLL